jgi:hypothetical protein
LILEGIVDANQVVVSQKVQGILERLNVDVGSSVRAGPENSFACFIIRLVLVVVLVLERLSDPIHSVLDGGNDHELKFILTFEASFCENAPENSFAPLSFVLVLPMNTRSMSLAIKVL